MNLSHQRSRWPSSEGDLMMAVYKDSANGIAKYQVAVGRERYLHRFITFHLLISSQTSNVFCICLLFFEFPMRTKRWREIKGICCCSVGARHNISEFAPNDKNALMEFSCFSIWSDPGWSDTRQILAWQAFYKRIKCFLLAPKNSRPRRKTLLTNWRFHLNEFHKTWRVTLRQSLKIVASKHDAYRDMRNFAQH